MQPDQGTPPTPDTPPDPNATATAEPGLPPVKPPSGRFILQLFLVPGFIIAVAVGLFLFVKWMTGSPTSPDKFLRDLDNTNAEVRWRAASDLGQVLPRNPQLATDPVFGLSLAERLRRALSDNADAEIARKQKVAQGKPIDSEAAKALQAEREHIIFLLSSLGNFQVPVGAPLLAELADREAGIDPENDFHRRSAALWALTVLGNNLRKFDQLPPERKTEIMLTLRQEAEGQGERADWARASFNFLDGRLQQKPTTALPIADVLARAAKADAPFLRNQSAQALAFWDGEKVEETLLTLTLDDGRGEDPVKRDREQEEYRKAHPDEVRNLNRRQVSYTAVLNLARRAGGKLGEAQYALLREMLDEEGQKKVWYTEDPIGKGSHEAAATQTVVYALQGVDQLRRQDPRLALPLQDAIDKLVNSDNKAISAEAKELAEMLKGVE